MTIITVQNYLSQKTKVGTNAKKTLRSHLTRDGVAFAFRALSELGEMLGVFVCVCVGNSYIEAADMTPFCLTVGGLYGYGEAPTSLPHVSRNEWWRGNQT
jgi:hypothetical protein